MMAILAMAGLAVSAAAMPAGAAQHRRAAFDYHHVGRMRVLSAENNFAAASQFYRKRGAGFATDPSFRPVPLCDITSHHREFSCKEGDGLLKWVPICIINPTPGKGHCHPMKSPDQNKRQFLGKVAGFVFWSPLKTSPSHYCIKITDTHPEVGPVIWRSCMKHHERADFHGWWIAYKDPVQPEKVMLINIYSTNAAPGRHIWHTLQVIGNAANPGVHLGIAPLRAGGEQQQDLQMFIPRKA